MTLPMLELLCFEAAKKQEKSLRLDLTQDDFMSLAREIEDSYPETYTHTASYNFSNGHPIRVHGYLFAGIKILITIKEDEKTEGNGETVLQRD